MLRWALWLLVLANVGYFAWTQQGLAALGWVPHDEREPQRLQTQIQPESLRLLNAPRLASAPLPANPPPSTPAPTHDANPTPPPATETAPATTDTPVAPPPAAPPTPEVKPNADPVAPKVLPPAPPPSPAVAAPPAPVSPPAATAVADARACWLAGGFTVPQADTLRAALTLLDLPRGTWQLNESRSGGRWIVYMGRYDNNEQLARKKAELRALNVAFRDVSTPGLGPGLALGTYSSEAGAQQALQDAVRAGVRTARVAQERAESTSVSLRLPSATADQRRAVVGLGAALAGKPLRPCN